MTEGIEWNTFSHCKRAERRYENCTKLIKCIVTDFLMRADEIREAKNQIEDGVYQEELYSDLY